MENIKRITIIIAFSILYCGLMAQSQAVQQSAFTKSYESEQAGKYITAINDLKPVYKPDAYFVNIRMGWLYYLAKQYTESIKFYNMAISLQPYAIEARFGCIKPLSAIESWENVKGQYLQILKIDPQNTLANYWLGVIYYNRKSYIAAEKLFEKVVNLYPLDYDSNIMLAWTKLNMGKSADARVLFYHALIIRPNDNSALSGLKELR
jgi:tetratricopeptide (TPR) repeat protein